MLLLTECYTLKQFSSIFVINVLLHLIAMSPDLLWSIAISQSCLVFHDLDSLEEYWPGTCWMSPDLHLSDVSLMIRLDLWVWGKNTTKVKSSSHHILSGVQISIWHHWYEKDTRHYHREVTAHLLEWLLFKKKKNVHGKALFKSQCSLIVQLNYIYDLKNALPFFLMVH